MRHLRTNALGGAYLEDDRKGKVIGKDLFGNDIIEYEADRKETPSIHVATKLTRSEYKQLEAITEKFDISKYQYCRDAIRQQLRDHEMLLSND